jgi:HAD superfamily phosphatase
MNHPATSSVPSAIVVFDIDGVVRDVAGSYRRALADTVEHFTRNYRPSPQDIDTLKTEGIWNNDWQASQELVYRYFEAQGQPRSQLDLDYDALVAFFQSRYRGSDPHNWNGYITQEPLLMESRYLEKLTAAGIAWGFFSGATRGSATYVLEKRMGLSTPVLVAMEDAPGKPDPTGLLLTIAQLEQRYAIHPGLPVVYVGDTVADLHTVEKAQQCHPDRTWLGVGVLPPHVQSEPEHCAAYRETLKAAGALLVLEHVQQLSPAQIQQLQEFGDSDLI